MTRPLDRSHDPSRRSWVTGADAHPDFPVQNLPFGRIAATDPRDALVTAIGDRVLSFHAALDAGWGGDLPAAVVAALRGGSLAPFAALSPDAWHGVRLALSDALSDPAWAERLGGALRDVADVRLILPHAIGDYTDFYASIHHATNVGSMFRPDNPLLPNYKWVPIGYHGRASSIVPSGTAVRRPWGQTKAADATAPTTGLTRSLDYELELGLVIGGTNALGQRVEAAAAADRIFGVVLLNDWSARDIQSWEYQPLGPFLAKNFASTISPWVVTSEALRPFRVPMPPRPDGDPAPLSYLQLPDDETWSLTLDVLLASAAMRSAGATPFRVSRVAYQDAMYWSPAQLVAHHGSNGCNLTAGDLLGTGTISGPVPEARGCLLERTWRGAEPLTLPDGAARRFLEDGDEVLFTGRAAAEGAVAIGFGPCRGEIVAG